jgi:GT2 family glycosyltransferase
MSGSGYSRKGGPEAAPKVIVVVLNWNGKEDTAACLDSLAGLDYPNVETVVVDNDSSDGSADHLRTRYPQHKLIQSDKNLGYAGGNNLGIRYAVEQGADYVWVLNNDTEVSPDALTHLVSRMQQDTSIGLCGCTLLYHHDPRTIQVMGGGRYLRWKGVTRPLGEGEPFRGADAIDREAIESQLDYIAGASVLASRNFLNDVGLMSEAYFLYYEEMDWAERARSNGRYKLAYAPGSIIRHKEGAATGGNRTAARHRSYTSDYYQLRNRLLFTRNRFPRYYAPVWCTVTFALLKRAIRGQWQRVGMILELLRGRF